MRLRKPRHGPWLGVSHGPKDHRHSAGSELTLYCLLMGLLELEILPSHAEKQSRASNEGLQRFHNHREGPY